MYIDVSEETGEVTKVVLGSLITNENQYVFAIKNENNEIVYHNLPHGIDGVRIVGVSNSQYYFLQNKEGNEFVFKLNLENPLEGIDFVKSCPKRCE
ncbi:hypothetical protein ACFP56_09295 [Paenibacillus septentrionalis]|uniref:Uncharacterized protein n=1 Tax=Paenibacillus septentrionalis TaxID=429342 RepID=A0ABW1V4Y7_9BACL